MPTPIAGALLAATLVVSAEVCLHVAAGRCEGPGTSFPPDVGSLSFLTRFEGHAEGTVVQHVWTRGKSIVLAVPFRLVPSPARVHSSRSIGEDDLGKWSAIVTDASGAELARVDFEIVLPEEPEGPPEPSRTPEGPGKPEPVAPASPPGRVTPR